MHWSLTWTANKGTKVCREMFPTFLTRGLLVVYKGIMPLRACLWAALKLVHATPGKATKQLVQPCPEQATCPLLLCTTITAIMRQQPSYGHDTLHTMCCSLQLLTHTCRVDAWDTNRPNSEMERSQKAMVCIYVKSGITCLLY